MHILLKRTVIAAACALLVGATSGPDARSQSTLPDSLTVRPLLIDRVMATVEDRAVLKSEVDALLKQYLLQSQRTSLPADEEKAVREDILESLISDRLMAIQAEKDGIKVDDRELNAAVDRQIDENKRDLGGDDGFNKALEAEGLTIEKLRAIYEEKLRGSFLIDKLMDKEIRSEIQVTDREVEDYYRDHAAELQKRPATVTLAHILIVPQPTDSVRAAALAKITAIEQQLRDGKDFAALAREYSDCPSAKYGGSLGLIKLEDLNNPAFEEAARKLTVGQVSPPVLTEFGYHLIKLDGVEGEEVRVSHILVAVQPTPQDLERAAKLAETVRAEIIGGADFATMAERYSADRGSKGPGDFTSEVALEDMPAEIRELIKGVPAGEVAPVVKDAKGFRVLKILSWNEERPYTFAEAKDFCRQMALQQKFRDRLASYINELKKRYSVEIRGE
jgi:peptidyl-prolyl cis-trans isomerase SurA